MKKILLPFLFFLFQLQIPSTVQAQQWQWAKSNANGSPYGFGVTTDQNGNIIVAGCFYSNSLTFGTVTINNSNPGSPHLFLLKYDPAGNMLWLKGAKGSGSDVALGVVCDSVGNIFISGHFSGSSFIFGGDTLVNSLSGKQDIFVAKWDAGGNEIWARKAGGADDDYSYGMAIDRMGDIYITGFLLSASATFNSQVVNNSGNAGTRETYLAKYYGNGNLAWVRRAGCSLDDEGYSVAIDNMGDVLLTGNYKDASMNFGSDTLPNAGFRDIFLAKYDTAGNFLWAKGFGGTNEDMVNSIATDGTGNSFLAGWFASPSIPFGSNTFNKTSSMDFFLVKVDNTGNVTWSRTEDSTSTANPTGIKILTDNLGNVYVAASFWDSTFNFGNINLVNVGSSPTRDIFMMKCDVSGNLSWIIQIGNTSDEIALGWAIDSSGSLILTGHFGSAPLVFGSDTVATSATAMFVAKFQPGPLETGAANGNRQLKFYPNPSTGHLIIDIEKASLLARYKLELLNSLGQNVYNTELSNSKNSVDFSSKALKGIFYLRITDKKGNIVEGGKVVLQ